MTPQFLFIRGESKFEKFTLSVNPTFCSDPPPPTSKRQYLCQEFYYSGHVRYHPAVWWTNPICYAYALLVKTVKSRKVDHIMRLVDENVRIIATCKCRRQVGGEGRGWHPQALPISWQMSDLQLQDIIWCHLSVLSWTMFYRRLSRCKVASIVSRCPS